MEINLKQCESFCNEKQVYPAMKQLVQELNLSVRAAAREVSKLTHGLVTASRADKVYRDRTPATNVAPTTPTTTNPEQIQQLKNERDSAVLENENMAKEIIDEIAENIREEITDTRVGTKIDKAVKEVWKRHHKPVEKKTMSDVEKLDKALGNCSTQLQYLVGGDIKVNRDNLIYFKSIRHHAPMIIISFWQLGIDVVKVVEFMKGESYETEKEVDFRRKDLIE
ncbi:hypothetical protein DRO49_03495 [Candidatus Bathyarchaeota archaeon]|nr:MAG: hypothetical protein DRO49_03495 [Candidatus Bathyarchaeota archaeon]